MLPEVPPCNKCRRIGPILFPIWACEAQFNMDGSVRVDHGTGLMQLVWESMEYFYSFHALIVVGQRDKEAFFAAQNKWTQELDRFERHYKAWNLVQKQLKVGIEPNWTEYFKTCYGIPIRYLKPFSNVDVNHNSSCTWMGQNEPLNEGFCETPEDYEDQEPLFVESDISQELSSSGSQCASLLPLDDMYQPVELMRNEFEGTGKPQKVQFKRTPAKEKDRSSISNSNASASGQVASIDKIEIPRKMYGLPDEALRKKTRRKGKRSRRNYGKQEWGNN
ncbi:hypothetical protein ACI3LY_004382 [Candidozyma auris]|uniref:Uncharacterized protein n=2 Tax=Candidozyma auris TaxID=498019 RepID=A0A8F3AI13_CANAR|nr:hypothetical protein QG37_01292 [[Candida] auris]QWW24795.1 hypothetical protein CA7LBN_003652 [[Candida] auris]